MMKINLSFLSLLITTIAYSAPVSANINEINYSGAIADSVYYQIGGGSVVTPSLTRKNPNVLGLGLSWNSDLMCGNFDIGATVKNQLNGATEGFHQMMGNVINSATGAVMSLPAMVIQRANPQLYDTLTNGVLQGKLDFGNIKTSCEEMANKMADRATDAGWLQTAKTQNYANVAKNEKDAVRAQRRTERESGNNGVTWVGGEKVGGRNQTNINVVSDTITAGYNIVNNREVTTKSNISSQQCQGSICQTWQKPDDAAKWVTRVTGEQMLSTCNPSESSCPKSQSKAGVGLTPVIHEEQEKIALALVELVNETTPVNATSLSKTNGGSIKVTRGIIESLRDDPDAEILIQRLSGEMATAKVIEESLMARRLLLAGMREPNINQNKEALERLEKALYELDQEITQLKLEIDLKRSLTDNAATQIVERRRLRDAQQGMAIENPDDPSQRFNQLNHPDKAR